MKPLEPLTIAFVLLALASGACASRARVAAPPEEESARFGAALAYLTVDNQTRYAVEIVFRPGAGAGGEVGVGTVDAGTKREVAPIPAGEAILLVARVEDMGEYALPARSFVIGERWTWVIPADAEFRARAP